MNLNLKKNIVKKGIEKLFSFQSENFEVENVPFLSPVLMFIEEIDVSQS